VLEPVRTPDAELTRLMQATQGGQFNRPQAIAQFRFYLDQDREILRGLESLAKDFQQMLELPDVRTTDLGFKIGVLNSGDSDGVIFDSGAVKFGATELPINSDQFTVVKAHSFETIEFSAFYGQLDTERQKLQDIVKNGASDDVPFKISVRIGDKSVETVGALPKKEQ
jgi:hypothetical protein